MTADEKRSNGSAGNLSAGMEERRQSARPGNRRPLSNTSLPSPPKRKRGRLSAGTNYRARKQKYKPRVEHYIRMPESYDQDSSDELTPPFAVREFLGGYSDKFECLGGGFIYGARSSPSSANPFDECPKVACAVVDKAISPLEMDAEFGKEEKKTLPSYYYTGGGGKPVKNNKKAGKKEKKAPVVLDDVSLEEPQAKTELKTPTFIGNSPWCFASPDKNFQIYVLPPKPNILKFDTQPDVLNYGGYGGGGGGSYGRAYSSKPYQYSRGDSVEINREMSGLSLHSAKSEPLTATMPGVIQETPRNNTRAGMTGSGKGSRRLGTPTSRLPGRAQYN